MLGAVFGSILVLVSVNVRIREHEKVEPWLGREKLAWILIGCGCAAWAIGECFWRYYVTQGQSPFPSLADVGYASFFPLVFLGLLYQPFSRSGTRKHIFLLLDSLIAMGALLSIAWFLVLGALAQSPAGSLLAKSLGLYYPFTDVVMLCYIVFILLQGEDSIYLTGARRIGLLVVWLGLCAYIASDFIFNTLQNMGQYVEGNWIDLGWPLGMTQ